MINPDIAKVIVVVVLLFYLNLKARPHMSPASYRIMSIGLCLLFFASVLDFADGFRSLDYVPILGREAPLHDILEDQFFDVPGIALFAFGAFREIVKRK